MEHTSRSGSRMFGEVVVENKPYESFPRYKYDDRFVLKAMFIYDGKYLEISKHAARCDRTMF